MPKLIPLRAWATLHMDPAPSLGTLRAWARAGNFDPPAQLIGREYRVREDARYVQCTPPAPLKGLSARARAILENPEGC